jgi:hypothetical protein
VDGHTGALEDDPGVVAAHPGAVSGPAVGFTCVLRAITCTTADRKLRHAVT